MGSMHYVPFDHAFQIFRLSISGSQPLTAASHQLCKRFNSSEVLPTMAENLHNALSSMSIIDDDPIVLPDGPEFRFVDENATSLLGRLLNPDCVSMQRMIEYMPTAWRVYDRVRGIALSKDRFQFIFQREEDLERVLKYRPWSYNRWTMLLERWSPTLPEDFLSTVEVWVRIKHIPVNHFTLDTMNALASKVGHVEEIAYDPKVSQVRDYIRALITLNVANPAIAAKQLILPSGEIVVIEYEYEKIHKRCFHCQRLTHEKLACPWLKKGKGAVTPGSDPGLQNKLHWETSKEIPDAPKLLDAPPGFPPLFPELSAQEQRMAVQYVSHSNETERNARIQRVQQSIIEAKSNLTMSLLKITSDLDKSKGHVYDYNMLPRRLQLSPSQTEKHAASEPVLSARRTREEQSSPSDSASSSFHFMGSTGFSMGALQSSTAGALVTGKKCRKRLLGMS